MRVAKEVSLLSLQRLQSLCPSALEFNNAEKEEKKKMVGWLVWFGRVFGRFDWLVGLVGGWLVR